MNLPVIDHSVFISASPEKVFETLTHAQGWDAWFTQGMVLDLRVGGEIHFCWKDWGSDHISTEDHGRILEIVPNQKFAFLWNRHAGGTTVTFYLEPRGAGTVVRITDEGYTSPEYFMTCATGWGEALTLLKFYLEYRNTYGIVP